MLGPASAPTRLTHLFALQAAGLQLGKELPVQQVEAVLGVAVQRDGAGAHQRAQHARQAARPHLQAPRHGARGRAWLSRVPL